MSQYCSCFTFCFFGHEGRGISSPQSGWTLSPCTGRQNPNHRITRKSPNPLPVSLDLPFLDISCEQNHKIHDIFGIWLLSLSIRFSGFVHVVAFVSVLYSFSQLPNIPSCSAPSSLAELLRVAGGAIRHPMAAASSQLMKGSRHGRIRVTSSWESFEMTAEYNR